MTGPDSSIVKHFRVALLTLLPILIVLLLLVFLPPDGNERGEWAQFIGRFHPLAVHFPIALILLVPMLELAGFSNRFSYLHLAASFVLGFATIGATVAAALGWSLARSGAYSGPLLQQHMWGGISLAAACWLCWLLRTRTNQTGPGMVYAIALLTSMGLVAWTGYRGGQLSLGEDHLTEHMPAGLRHMLRVRDETVASSANPGDDTFYGVRVQPIFAARCVSCHGPSKHKADLRLDSYRALMRGGKDGPVVQVANALGSDLFRRITLPAGHDDFMPKGSSRPLSPDQVKAIELWIGAGASRTLAADAIKDAPTGSASPAVVADVIVPEIDPAATAKLREGIAVTVAELQKRFPGILGYESRGSADLYLNASILGPKFGDSDLAAMAPIAEHITVADLSRTAITDRSVTAIAAMRRVHVLRLMNTGITDAMVAGLGALDQLESLNLFGTQVTSAALPTIERLPKLAHCYAAQTAISPETPISKDLAAKLVF